MAVEACFEGGCIGSQKTVLMMFTGLVGNGLRIPLAALLAGRMGMGVDGVWLAVTLSTILKAPLKWLCYERVVKDDT